MPKKVILTCRQIKLSLWIGFHRGEGARKQELLIDFEATLRAPTRKDEPSAIQLDYSKAYQLIQKRLAGKKIKLIETVAENVISILTEHFPVRSVTVSVTKKPFNLKGASVTYSLSR